MYIVRISSKHRYSMCDTVAIYKKCTTEDTRTEHSSILLLPETSTPILTSVIIEQSQESAAAARELSHCPHSHKGQNIFFWMGQNKTLSSATQQAPVVSLKCDRTLRSLWRTPVDTEAGAWPTAGDQHSIHSAPLPQHSFYHYQEEIITRGNQIEGLTTALPSKLWQ